jgi:hypothetical protein
MEIDVDADLDGYRLAVLPCRIKTPEFNRCYGISIQILVERFLHLYVVDSTVGTHDEHK